MRAWVAAWREWSGAGKLVWSERKWRSLGAQSVPERIFIQNADEAAAWAGELDRWRTAVARFDLLSARRPATAEKLPRYFDLLADSPSAEINRIGNMLDWLDTNATRDMYPRQVPIAGLDTKWLETRTAMIADLWGAMPEFRRPPFTTRVRLLDPALCRATGGLPDVTAPVADLAALDIRPKRVWIVENLQTGLAFGPLEGTAVFMGLGYGVTVLGSVPWIQDAECLYWGDLDTHGFAILTRARTAIRIESALMDEQTLLLHREMWAEEPVPCAIESPSLLTQAEREVFEGLQQNRWGTRVRLEQERIAWDYAWKAILSLAAGHH